MDEQKLQEFLKELTDLTRKYGIGISGCGCCGSPSLDPLQPNEMPLDQQYVEENGTLFWKKPKVKK